MADADQPAAGARNTTSKQPLHNTSPVLHMQSVCHDYQVKQCANATTSSDVQHQWSCLHSCNSFATSICLQRMLVPVVYIRELKCRLIKANRQTYDTSKSSNMETPWGQPEPVTRGVRSRPSSPLQHTKHGSQPSSPGLADRQHASSDHSLPSTQQVRVKSLVAGEHGVSILQHAAGSGHEQLYTASQCA